MHGRGKIIGVFPMILSLNKHKSVDIASNDYLHRPGGDVWELDEHILGELLNHLQNLLLQTGVRFHPPVKEYFKFSSSPLGAD